jgi:hypothetical protein
MFIGGMLTIPSHGWFMGVYGIVLPPSRSGEHTKKLWKITIFSWVNQLFQGFLTGNPSIFS